MGKVHEKSLLWEGMTMRTLMWAALASGILLAGGAAARAQDTIRLGGPSQSSFETGVNTELVRGGGHGGHGGWHGGHAHFGHAGHFHGGHWHGGWNGWNGWRGYGWYGYGRYWPNYYAGYYPYSSYYYPTYYYPTYYYPAYAYGATYYAQPTYYPTVSYSYPVSGETVPPPSATPSNYQRPVPVPPMPMPDGNGTYLYDGGPRSPVPMPIPELTPPNAPRPVPIDGKLVSLPTGTSLGVAFVGGAPVVPRTTATPTRTTPPRVVYPAYGE
jgi:hypothetical protein